MVDFSRVDWCFSIEQLLLAEQEGRSIRINNVNQLQKPSYILDMKARDANKFLKENKVYLPFNKQPYTRLRKKDGTLLGPYNNKDLFKKEGKYVRNPTNYH